MIGLDTHKLVAVLIKQGFSNQQAEAILDAMVQIHKVDQANYINRLDLLRLENKLVYWIVGNSIGVAGLLGALHAFN